MANDSFILYEIYTVKACIKVTFIEAKHVFFRSQLAYQAVCLSFKPQFKSWLFYQIVCYV